jgi:predicted DNA-binding transcriptional regulator AlpA
VTKILRPRQVCELIGVSPMQLWRWRKARQFPEPIALGVNSKGFLADEVEAWVEARRAERDSKTARRDRPATGADENR